MDLSLSSRAAVAGTCGALLLAWLRKAILGTWMDPVCQRRDLSGKTAVVTGANSGLGLETAVGLAKMGAAVIVTGRSQESAQSAARAVEARSGRKVTACHGDMADLSSVRQLASSINRMAASVDILVCNAGMIYAGKERRVSSAGHELMFHTNYLSHFYLCRQLLPALQSAVDGARVVSVCSKMASKADTDWEATEGFNTDRAYGQSKLAQIMHMKELSNRQDTIVAVSAMPGLTRTPLFGKAGFPPIVSLIMTLLQPLFWVLLRSPKAGAQTVLHACVSPDVTPGTFYDNCAPRDLLKGHAGDTPEELARLWKKSEAAIPRR